MFTSLFSKTNQTRPHQFQHKRLTKDVLCKVWLIINISNVNIITFKFINSSLLITYLGGAALFYCSISFLFICNFIIDIYSAVHLIIARAIIRMWLLHIVPTRGTLPLLIANTFSCFSSCSPHARAEESDIFLSFSAG